MRRKKSIELGQKASEEEMPEAKKQLLADPLLTVEEACNYLRISQRQFYYLVEKNEIVAFTLGEQGREKRVTRSDLLQFVERNRQQAIQPTV